MRNKMFTLQSRDPQTSDIRIAQNYSNFTIKESEEVRGWQPVSTNDQTANVLGLWAMWSQLQLFNSAVILQKAAQ